MIYFFNLTSLSTAIVLMYHYLYFWEILYLEWLLIVLNKNYLQSNMNGKCCLSLTTYPQERVQQGSQFLQKIKEY